MTASDLFAAPSAPTLGPDRRRVGGDPEKPEGVDRMNIDNTGSDPTFQQVAAQAASAADGSKGDAGGPTAVLSTSSKPDSTVASESHEFLMTEFREIAAEKRHTDDRREKAVTVYLSFTTIAITAFLLFWQRVSNTQMLVAVGSSIAFGLFVAGVHVANRKMGVAVLKAEYAYAMALIRLRYVLREPEMSKYIHMPVADYPCTPPGRRPIGFLPSVKTPFLYSLSFLTGLILAGFVCGLIWLKWPSLPWAAYVAVASVLVVGFLLYTFLRARKFRQDALKRQTILKDS
jgi:hypothetical protein